MLDPVEEIKAKIDIFDLVSQYVQLKKAGKSFKGLCPFHQEKTPSFIVSPDKQIAYCFGCNKGGDIFKFMMEVERMDFSEALVALGKRAGVELKGKKIGSQDNEYKKKLLEINQKAKEIFVEELFSSAGKKALKYIKDRGLSDVDIKTFELGFAPDSFEFLHRKLQDLGYAKKEITDSGVASMKDFSQDSLYDRFRNRLIFPINNSEGSTVAFAGRILEKDDKQAKYVNSPETALYHKSNVLYNFDRAKESMKQKDVVLVVEGYTDAIALVRSGIENVVAVCGTALTERHAKMLKRFANTIIFCFDSDEAGIMAMKRNAEPIIRNQINLKAVSLGEHKDPDEYIGQDQKGFLDILEKPEDFIEFLIQRESDKHDINTLEGRRAFVDALFPLLKIFPFQTERDLYIGKIANLFGTTIESIKNDLKKIKTTTSTVQKKDEDNQSQSRRMGDVLYIIGILLSYPSFVPLVEEHYADISFEDEMLKSIYKKLKDHYNNAGSYKLDEDSELPQENKSKLKIVMLAAEEKCGTSEEEQKKTFLHLLARYKRQQHKEKVQRFRQVQEQGESLPSELLQEINNYTPLDTSNSH